VKPIAEGSSMGVIIVRDERSHPPQILASDEWVYGEEVLAETYVAGRELTCAVLGDRALGVTEIKPVSGEWYDFDAKYAGGGSIHVLPAVLKLNIYQRVQELALTAHQELGCLGVRRADLRYDDTPGGTGALVVLEVNTQPGMTQTSLVPEIAAHAGQSFGELVRWMVEDASLNR
jgi:D-alanine-D-alanine ligase